MGGLPTHRTVNGFAVNPEDPRIMFVAMRDGLFRSMDAGTSWKRIRKEWMNLASVTINPRNPAEMYLATMDGAIYMSADAGTTWKKQ